MKKILLSLSIVLTGLFATAQIYSCPGFRTQTQGGWGATPSGNNPGVYLQNNFAAAFPTGLEIGCGSRKIKLTTATAVRNFLPQGGTATMLPSGTLTNPTKTSYSNVLAGQLVAVTLAVGFDNNSPSFSSSSTAFRDLVISTGPFIGKSIAQFLTIANERIGGCTTSGYTFSQINAAATSINQAYDNGVSTGSFLVCPMVVNTNATIVTCFGGSNGTASVSVTGGIPPYSYAWSNGAAGNTSTAINLTAGTYSCTVSDVTGATKVVSIVVGSNPAIDVQMNVTNNSCNIANAPSNGNVVANVSGGVGPYSFLWDNGNNTNQISNAPAGQYCLTVTDNLGCVKNNNCTNVTEPSAVVVSAELTGLVACHDDCNGSTSASANGGTGAISIVWNNGAAGSELVNLCSGSYTATAQDQNGCSAVSNTVELDNPEIISMSSSLLTNDTDCANVECDGSASVEIAGGIAPYNYTWNVGEGNGSVVNGLCGGEDVSVNVSDARGCLVSFNVGLSECTVTECPRNEHRSQTQGGWGAIPKGNKPGMYLTLNFSEAFPYGITLGCGDNTMTFNSAESITNFLPVGGTSSELPTVSVLTGQLLTAMINIGFDSYFEDFGSSDIELADMYVVGCDLTIGEVIVLANQAIGGCNNDYSLDWFNHILTTINENYDNGTVDNGLISCFPSTDRSLTHQTNEIAAALMLDQVYPNPAQGHFNVAMNLNRDEVVTCKILSVTGQVVAQTQLMGSAGANIWTVDLSNLAAQLYIVNLSSSDNSSNFNLMVK